MTEVDYRAMYLKVRNELAELQQRHEQEPPPWWPAVENILNEYGLQAIDFVAEFKKALAQPEQPQRTWVGLTDEEVDECYYWKDRQWTTDELVRHVEAKLKEKNSA